jgi:iron(III) transport system ATP-binding protein
MSELTVKNLSKSYGAAIAIENINFTVQDGEFVTLLGPSGCGKSTTLASIAGLQMPSAGQIRAGDVTFFDSEAGIALPAEARDLGLVFQSYALWPHMSVRKNLEFPLRLRKIPKKEQDTRIAKVLALVEMSTLADRYPHELSGGQQQRVALARTLVYEPRILLLDEPLSNLDAKLRERARTWLGDIRHRIKLTTLYVTHDHGEALSLSDRIVVMNGGRIIQIGTPREIYERPTDPFVADFIGSSNFLHGLIKVRRDSKNLALVRLKSGQEIKVALARDIKEGRDVSIAIRPERLQIVDPNSFHADVDGTMLAVAVTHRSYFGAHWHYDFDIGGEGIKVSSQKEYDGNKVEIFVPVAACQVFETSPQGGEVRSHHVHALPATV